MTGYEPLGTPKALAKGLWIIDGPAVRSYGFPFSTRATVVQLASGALWVHSPTELTASLRAELDALGPVQHLIAPNQIHFVHVNDWVEAYPGATFWAAPDVHKRAARNGLHLPEATPLAWDRAEAPWAGQLDQLIVRGSNVHKEAVFFHRPSRSLIVTDLIEAFDTAKLPVHCRPFVWLNGIDNSDGKMPPLLRWTFRDKAALAEDVETLVSWKPRRIILAHGDCYEANGAAELQRAFRKLLNARAWETTVDEIKARENR